MNGGTSDPWAKKPTPPDKSKQETIERLSSKKFCEQCLVSGIKSPIQLFQLNDEEALLMCKNENCTYMPCENWETLVVKRNISQINRSSSRKARPLSLCSESSLSSRSISVQSAPQRLPVSVNKYSKSSTPSLIVKPQSSEANKSFSRLRQRPLSSPTPSIDSSASEEPERSTLVPIAPFLCRHAHSFASFEVKNTEDKQLQDFLSNRRESYTSWNLNRVPTKGLKRRGSSLDSDSLSSCSSSVDSRPTSPFENPVKTGGLQTQVKPTKKVVLSAYAVSKLREGSCKIRLVKNREGHTSHVKLVPLPNRDSSIISFTPKDNKRESSLIDSPFTLGGLELNPVKQIHKDLPSSATSSTFPKEDIADTKSSSSISIQAHIDAINQHLAALREAVSGTDFTLPTELSSLLPHASGNIAVPTNLTQKSPGTPESAPCVASTESEVSLDKHSKEHQNISGAESLLVDENSFDCTGLDAYFIDNFTL